METSLLYLDNTEITNETQLTFQEHKVQELITKQINLEYGVSDIMTIITLLIALGVMIISLLANHIVALSIPTQEESQNIEKKNSEKKNYLNISKFVAILILIGCLIYGIYGHNKESQDKALIQNQITKTISSINTYKTSKSQQEELQKLKQLPPKCICQTSKNKKPCKN
jgi:H+/gluconate symporter-like permease